MHAEVTSVIRGNLSHRDIVYIRGTNLAITLPAYVLASSTNNAKPPIDTLLTEKSDMFC